MNEEIKRKLKIADLDQTSESLKDLCATLIRSGYSEVGIRDEDVDKIYAVIKNKRTGEEFRSSIWLPEGQGYRYTQLETAKRTAKKVKKKGVHVCLCIPTENMVLVDCEIGNKEHEALYDKKILELREFKEYLALKKEKDAL